MASGMATLVASVIIGVLVGILSGMLGIGGGMVMVPVFRLGYGMQAIEATATSLFTIVPTSIAGLVTHVRNKTCIPKIGIAAGLGGACTSPLGVYLSSVSPSWLIMLAAAAVIVYSATTMFRKALNTPKDGDVSRASASTADTRENDSGFEGDSLESPVVPVVSSKGIAIGVAIGLLAGLMSGYVGVGGGFIMIPLFVSILGIAMKQASGTSLVAVCILAIPGVVEQCMLGNVLIATGIAMAVGSIPGAILGANLTRRVPERQLRFLFAGLLVVAAVMLVLNEIGL